MEADFQVTSIHGFSAGREHHDEWLAIRILASHQIASFPVGEELLL